MMISPNEYQVLWFDCGVTAGWAHLSIDFRAFSRPEHRIRPNLNWWDCGEFTGTEDEVLRQCLSRVDLGLSDISYLSFDVGGEDFDLTQIIGSKENLLSPVRQNAVLSWECRKRGIIYQYQNRAHRTNVTKKRLKAFGFEGRFRRNEFAAMQHAVTWVRNLKKRADERPWKLADNIALNAYWDCACEEGKKCDLIHPR